MNSSNRFDTNDAAHNMMAVVTTGNGGYDKLDYRAVPVPVLASGETLIQVLAAGVNNTEINTRLGWYSASVTGATEDTKGADVADGGWNDATPFPFIQGTDCCGRVVAVADDASQTLIGKRVMVRPCMRTNGFGSMENRWMASDFDGAFAQFVKVPISEVFAVDCDWQDAELATLPCAYGTAENMVHRAGVVADNHVLVAGASGGVGSATVQLVKRRSATVTAVVGPGKADAVRALGADQIVDRNALLVDVLGKDAVDVVIDNVAGDGFQDRLEVMKRGGRYASSGAIAGPNVAMDMRTFYLRDLTLIGCTAWDEPVFPNLVSYIERGEIKPVVAAVYPLNQIADAQRAFMEKNHVGNFVLIPPVPQGVPQASASDRLSG